jgi:hypothetical protein
MRMNGTISRQMATGCWQTPSSSIKSKWYILYTASEEEEEPVDAFPVYRHSSRHRIENVFAMSML